MWPKKSSKQNYVDTLFPYHSHSTVFHADFYQLQIAQAAILDIHNGSYDVTKNVHQLLKCSFTIAAGHTILMVICKKRKEKDKKRNENHRIYALT